MICNRRGFLLNSMAGAGLIGAAVATSCSKRIDDSPLAKSIRYLWAQQSDDGGFHSATYGLLRSGQSLTPFVLLALLSGPQGASAAPSGGIERAIAFIKARTTPEGVLGLLDESAADYPNYATALAVSALVKSKSSGHERVIEPMVAQLRAQQFTENNGWAKQDAPYGGWGMGGPIHRPPEAGHVDLSMTRYVLEALRSAGVPTSDPSITRALVFLERSQNPDGGFYFSPVNPEINKAGKSGEGFASYGTTTADGVLALRAAGIPDADPRIAKAIQWLKDHHRADQAPGFDGATDQRWASGLRFYYAHAISLALPQLPVELPPPGADGGYRNSNNLVKEDDPLIATGFALYALARQLKSS
jgi:hypothetical protein